MKKTKRLLLAKINLDKEKDPFFTQKLSLKWIHHYICGISFHYRSKAILVL